MTPRELAAAPLRTLWQPGQCTGTWGARSPVPAGTPLSPQGCFPSGRPLCVPAELPHRAAGLLVAAPGPCVGVRGSVRAPPSPPREEIPPCAPQGCSFMSASGSVSTSLQPGVVVGSCRQGPPLSPIVPLDKDSFGAGVCSRREKPSGFPRPTLTGKVDGASSMVSLPVNAGQRFWG